MKLWAKIKTQELQIENLRCHVKRQKMQYNTMAEMFDHASENAREEHDEVKSLTREINSLKAQVAALEHEVVVEKNRADRAEFETYLTKHDLELRGQ